MGGNRKGMIHIFPTQKKNNFGKKEKQGEKDIICETQERNKDLHIGMFSYFLTEMSKERKRKEKRSLIKNLHAIVSLEDTFPAFPHLISPQQPAGR